MNELLKTILSLSLSGSLLILLLFFLAPLIRGRLSKRFQYYLWLVVVARLLLPFTPAESPVGNLFRRADAPPTAALPAPGNYGPPASAMEALPETAAPASQANGGEALRSSLWVVWLGGAAALLLRKITVYQDFTRYIKAGREEVVDVAQLNLLAKTGEELGVGRPVELWTHSLISSPLLLGLFHPAIVLPTGDLSPVDLRYTVAHELTHYKQMDLLYKWVVQLALCVHWFNPLVWLMARETSRACELACDEAVMERLAPEERRAYGDALLRAMGTGGSYQSSLASVTLAESGERLKERLGAILSFPGATRGRMAAAFCLAAVLILGACAAGAYTGPEPLARGEETGRPAPESQSEPAPPAAVPPSGEETWAEEAARYYEERDLPRYAAAFPFLGEEEKQASLAQCRADGELPFFSAAINQLERDDPLVGLFAEQAYQSEQTNFFSVLTWRMEETTIRAWLDRAGEDGSITFQLILLGVLGEDEEAEALQAEWEQKRLEEFRAYGITLEGSHYYYKGRPVRVLVELQARRFQVTTLETNPLGEVYVQVIRKEDGTIQEVSEMPKEQLDQYFGDAKEEKNDSLEIAGADWRTSIVPVEVETLPPGEYAWLGIFTIKKRDQVYYSVTARSGDQLTVGFARAGEDAPEVTFHTVSNTGLQVDSGFMTWQVEPGEYLLFIRAGETPLEGVTGKVIIASALENNN